MDEIPMKLRCSVCSLLAVGAVRMPCCDQNICENCKSCSLPAGLCYRRSSVYISAGLASLDQECPVCLHANVDRDLIKPNKTLRTTIKAFLKKKVMERDNLRKREEAARLAAAAATATPAIPEITKDVPAQPTAENVKVLVDGEAKVKPDADDVPKASSQVPPSTNQEEGHQPSSEAQMDIPRPSIEVRRVSPPNFSCKSNMARIQTTMPRRLHIKQVTKAGRKSMLKDIGIAARRNKT